MFNCRKTFRQYLKTDLIIRINLDNQNTFSLYYHILLWKYPVIFTLFLKINTEYVVLLHKEIQRNTACILYFTSLGLTFFLNYCMEWCNTIWLSFQWQFVFDTQSDLNTFGMNSLSKKNINSKRFINIWHISKQSALGFQPTCLIEGM